MAAWCKSSCERNRKICDKIEVEACAKNCNTAFGGVADFCPIKLGKFTSCVDGDELRCKAGAKIRTKGCKDLSRDVSLCIMLKSVKPEERCKSQCTEYGQCQIVDGSCTATAEDCDKLDKCKGGKCSIVDNICTPKS